MPVVPINPDYSNISEFINSLYDSDVRTLAPLQQAIQRGAFTAEFSSEVQKIPPVWLAGWQQSQGDPYNATDFSHLKPQDQRTFAFLANFIRQNALSLYVPVLEYLGQSSGAQPRYQLSGYTQSPFLQGGQWNDSTVTQFLELFVHGAHMVVVYNPFDLVPGTAVQDFYQAFREGPLASGEKHDPGNSHYTSLNNVCGYYYPSVTKNTAPPDPTPFNLAWLVGLTVSQVTCNSSNANAFLQLEGWQDPMPRHNADYSDLYQPTLWNISTFGASAYSEKRGTAVFLAPANWNPQANANTLMPPYMGAESLQPWLNTSLVQLPAGFWQVVVRSSNQPLSGQKERSSENFRLYPPPGTRSLRWSLLSADNPSGLRFDVKQDVSGKDPTALHQVQNGQVLSVLPGADNYYIANPSGGASPGNAFTVLVQAVT